MELGSPKVGALMHELSLAYYFEFPGRKSSLYYWDRRKEDGSPAIEEVTQLSQ